MTSTSLHRRRRSNPVRLALLAAAGLGAGAGVAGYVVSSRTSGPPPADARPEPTGSGSAADAQPEPVSQGVRSERFALEDEWGAGPLDGAWWPESPEATQAVPDLLELLPDELRVSRVALPMPDWSDDRPKTLRLDDDRTIHLAWFAGMQRHTARITFETGDAVTVLVLPSDTEAGAASNVLSQVGDQRSREDLLAEAGVEV
jgi:hypothetical protein